MSSESPKIAIVGRQNVGKSTLANRLFGSREAIAHELPGVTRDRLELATSWRGRTFTLVDTGGYRQRATGIEALVSAQAERASKEADVVLLVVDVTTGITEEDDALARRLRGARTPVMVVANKVDSDRDELDAFVFARLGLGEPVTVSALHGRGSGDLLDRIVALLPDRSAGPEVEGEPRFALIGRPNVGKSSLFNRLVGDERSVVYEEAGTTRDSVDAVVSWATGPVRFVDTAGLRRASRTKGVEYYGFVRSVRAIGRAHVVVLVLDGGEGFTGEDKRIAARVVDAGRGLVIVANKWDLVEGKERASKELEETAAPFAAAALMRTSARSGFGVRRLAPALLDLHERWSRRVSTSEVNRVVHDAQLERPAPHEIGRFRYATQVAAGPPSFVLFGGTAPDPSYQRFLENRLRRSFRWEGVPIRLRFRPKNRRRTGS